METPYDSERNVLPDAPTIDFGMCHEHTCSTVQRAARCGDAKAMKKLLKMGHCADSKDNRGWNALHEAAAGGFEDCVKLLLKARAFPEQVKCEDYINSLTHNSETPVYFAALNGHLRVLKCLIKSGADIHKMSNDLSCPLFAAVDSGHKEVVKFLVESGADVNGLYSVSGWSCLHQAVYKGHVEIVKFLVRVCSLEAVDDYEVTPTFIAAQYDRLQCLEVLIHAGANVNCQVKDLATPLFIASQEGHLDCVETLLANNANPNLYCNTEQWQLPIHAAVQFCKYSILEKLIPVTDRVCDQGEGKVSPVYTAVLSGRADILQILLSAGFSPDAQDLPEFMYHCPLHMAVVYDFENIHSETHNNCEITRMLLEAGAQVHSSVYTLALQGNVPDHLPLILETAGLPKGEKLNELVKVALTQIPSASFWLPLLLKAGLDPLLLVHDNMFEKLETKELNFLLEFVNWKILSSTLLQILCVRQARETWSPQKHFESVPALTHLSRLAVRAAVGSDALSKPSFVQRLPVPALLQDYLQFSDIFSAYTNAV